MLAAGAVLGVGYVATTAAWNDSELATASFSSPVWVLESETSTSPWGNSPQPPGSSLRFGADAMVTGTSYFAWMNLRTSLQTTVPGTVRLTDVARSGDLTNFLEYRAVRTGPPMTDALCGPAAFTSFDSVFIAGGPSRWEPIDDDPPAPAVFPIGPALDDVGICFEVRIRPSAGSEVSGLTGTASWGFTGISDD
ncbi:SipW-dependent-type signal peptide-containing protein [Microbacterium sp. NPDC057407]|uniref:SipW-dependent-type signal peptide-containing protein n=1 Tax=Microbacterium sp. NPDC057407 TaxID=3346120 RepID=UPI0036702F3C